MSPAKENFFKEQKVRSTNMDRSQDVLNTNITERFKALSSAGIETGMVIRYQNNTIANIGAANPQILTDDSFKVSVGQAWSDAGERILIPVDRAYNSGAPLTVDTQVPPVATPQSTGNTGSGVSAAIPFAKDAFSVNIDTYVVIKYLQTTDLSVSASVVPGFAFEYPKLDDGYEIVSLGSAADVSTALAEGGQFLAFVQIADGAVYNQWPTTGVATFERKLFSVDITSHTASPDAHHNKAHSHTIADGSADIDGDGDVTIGPGQEVKVGDENFRNNLAYMFGPGITLDPTIITDQNALLPFDSILNVVEPQIGFPDLLRLRTLKNGERIFVNGRVKRLITGINSGIVDPTAGIVWEIAVPSTVTLNQFWLLINDQGALEVQDLGVAPVTEPQFPRDKFVVGTFPAQIGNIQGGPSAFVDRRFFGVVGDKSFQSNSLKELSSFFTFNAAVQATGVALWTKYTVPATLLTSTGEFQSVKIFDLPERGVIEGVILKHSSPFTSGSLTLVTAEVGFDATLTPAESDRHATAFDVFQASGDDVSRATDQISPENFSATTGIWVTFRSYTGVVPVQGGNLSTASSSGGSLDIWVRSSGVPA